MSAARRVRRTTIAPLSRSPRRSDRTGNRVAQSYEAADPAARGVAVPQDPVADIQAVRLRVGFADLDACDRRAVRRIELVDDPAVGFYAPEEAAIPGEAVRPHAGRRNRPHDLAALR